MYVKEQSYRIISLFIPCSNKLINIENYISIINFYAAVNYIHVKFD